MPPQITTVANPSLSSPLWLPYTGTSDQPDTVSVFFKNAQNQIEIMDESLHNSINHNPLNFIDAALRIKEAAHRIFLYMKGENKDLWNALKNLIRGVVALVPLAGNVTLYLYDRIKTNFYMHPQIKTALENQEGPLLGIAFDGKIVISFTPDLFAKMLKTQEPEKPATLLLYMWISLISKNLENESDITRADLVNQFLEKIHP